MSKESALKNCWDTGNQHPALKNMKEDKPSLVLHNIIFIVLIYFKNNLQKKNCRSLCFSLISVYFIVSMVSDQTFLDHICFFVADVFKSIPTFSPGIAVQGEHCCQLTWQVWP